MIASGSGCPDCGASATTGEAIQHKDGCDGRHFTAWADFRHRVVVDPRDPESE